jgi:UDP-2,4-diacetamido-2,4,6-trideoxy-beta-L-altropyranose hydrolase
MQTSGDWVIIDRMSVHEDLVRNTAPRGRPDTASSLSVAIRVDSGAHIGGGHLLRCITAAQELRALGASVCFVSREHPGHLLAVLDDSGFPVYRLPPVNLARSDGADHVAWLGVAQEQDAAETLAALDGLRLDWLIVDHYAIDAVWERHVGQSTSAKIMVIDDLADRPHQADLLLDQNYFGSETAGRYGSRVPHHCNCLLGPRYALLHPRYKHLRQSSPRRSNAVERVLVYFGMHDATRATLRVLEALNHPEFLPIAVDVVVGNDPQLLAEVQAAIRARPGTTLHQSLPTLADLMASADLAIGAGGATTWERACLGVPAIVATIADNQVGLASVLAADGFIALVGRSTSMSSHAWYIVLRQLVRTPERISTLGSRARQLTDGYGAARVARYLVGGNRREVFLRPARAADELLLLEWANDPDTRHFAFNREQIPAAQHHDWLMARLEDANCMILIGDDPHGLPLGQVRFDFHDDRNEATINISVDVAMRGSGVGSVLLKEAVAAWRRQYPDTPIIAEVVVGNDASRRLFSAAGFTVAPSRRPDTITFASQT